MAQPTCDQHATTPSMNEAIPTPAEDSEMECPTTPKQDNIIPHQLTPTPSRQQTYLSPEAAIEHIQTALTDISSTLTEVDTNKFRDEEACDQSMKTTIMDLYKWFIEKANEMEETNDTVKSHDKLINANIKLTDSIASLTEANLNLTKQLSETHYAPMTPSANPTLQTTHNERGYKGPKLTHSANPIPIKPTTPTQKLLVECSPSNPAEHKHPSQLVIETFPLIPIDKHQMGPDVVTKANIGIQRRGVEVANMILAITFSMTGNIIMIAAPGCQGQT
ncbi:hypothetical protein BS47DRAFT_1369114 [Hydnum rufescens UP504]|uniref:Uncharacterized protein n=1 Tax=Hydnum rufescens UP504 TaxID=1448309 RepID=A0A9P6AES2_9AGAM|nr:hypothetical protein BS47DRAFT_1369114 [Hydnum rufescens UP504]